ncbi:diadenylate cyclase CdaA [Selenomonas sp. TAMA-11512]|uniref:diadenylate cyclase CdaA n=1 Tax=Selenomonas sp. TAMA-11512 TaxID=3095337 RepID=UPI003091D35B|nr:diadenylate cyclase CdaA [Selenomonas sp. TAMA-11512]
MSVHIPIQLQGILSTISILDLLDILIVAIILYKLYQMLQDTRAITLVKGILMLLMLSIATNWMGMHVIYWLLQQTVTLLFVALPIVFQPELRRTLEHIGQGSFFGRSVLLDVDQARLLINELDRAVMLLSSKKIGALIVIERNMKLDDVSATGIRIEGLITADFLMNVFIPNTPLHDGAAVIRGNRLIAAGCILPLTDNRMLSTELGTRHRAAIGLSEQCDALIIVVSEETGTVSIAENGKIIRYLNSERLKGYLRPVYAPKKTGFKDLLKNWRRKQ